MNFDKTIALINKTGNFPSKFHLHLTYPQQRDVISSANRFNMPADS